MIGNDPNARGKGAEPWHFCPWNGRQQQADKDALKTSHEDSKVEKRGQDAYKQVGPDHMGTSLSRLPRTELSSDGQTLSQMSMHSALQRVLLTAAAPVFRLQYILSLVCL